MAAVARSASWSKDTVGPAAVVTTAAVATASATAAAPPPLCGAEQWEAARQQGAWAANASMRWAPAWTAAEWSGGLGASKAALARWLSLVRRPSTPKLLHQTWIQGCELPARQRGWRDSCRRHLGPSWALWLWRAAENRNLVAQHYPSLLKTYDEYVRHSTLQHSGPLTAPDGNSTGNTHPWPPWRRLARLSSGSASQTLQKPRGGPFQLKTTRPRRCRMAPHNTGPAHQARRLDPFPLPLAIRRRLHGH